MGCRILIIDNDPDLSAQNVFLDVAKDTSVHMSYLSERRVGVGHARNAALESLAEHESILFFDDDQVPGGNWLHAFVEALADWPDAVLTGPVRPQLPALSPAWAEGAWAWGTREGDHGQLVRMAGFGNLLIPQTVLSAYQPRVPESFVLGPGEDTVVTLGLSRAGVHIRHVAGADAVEPIPPARLEKKWILARGEAEARAWAKTTKYLGLSRIRLWLSAGKAILGAVGNCAIGIIGRDEKRLLQGQRLFSRVLGYIKYTISGL